MELYQEILIEALSQQKMEITFPGLHGQDLAGLIDSVCYQALLRIRDIVRDDTLQDADCFQKIEAIVSALEDIGSGGEIRHDFG